MKTISVPDMMCENCVKRITKALTDADLKFQVSLADKTVTIDGCDNCLKTALEELEDLGCKSWGPNITKSGGAGLKSAPLFFQIFPSTIEIAQEKR